MVGGGVVRGGDGGVGDAVAAGRGGEASRRRGLGAVFALQSVHALIALRTRMAGRWFELIPVRLAQDGGLRDAGVMAGAPAMPSLRGLIAWHAGRAGLAVGGTRWRPPWASLGNCAVGGAELAASALIK